MIGGRKAEAYLPFVGVREHHPGALLVVARNQLLHILHPRLLDAEHNVDCVAQLRHDLGAGLLSEKSSGKEHTASYCSSVKQRRSQLSTSTLLSLFFTKLLIASGVKGARRSQTRRGSSRRMPNVASAAALLDSPR